ncbi:TonB-dependent receptor [Flavobacterium sp.]|uniref:SusC/RagA family TonB-linked outer membrane protein n=1 Tax=Flavobacterium sp. TaxID=239 RepID=UPI002BF67B98|nr:TonB-dependent receptor [Flavobacterium sp.]HSD06923.1 TonB-dependent receptor [Flavobacterium sp.]
MKLLKTFIFCISLILFSVYGYAQDASISGKVIDETGMPVPGATIVLKGTSTSVVTDFDGQFQIKAPKDGILTISFIGYKTVQESISGRTQLQLKLHSESQDLNEVVVVGYGTQKKSVTTGAISGVKGKEIEKVPAGRVEQVLQGRVSGVTIAASSGQPGSGSTIRIRGLTTFGDGGNNPLWVVDGVVVDAGGIGYLNQSDIESMEVLKDAASAAIYGTRAATGVILVTTKKGKAGKMTVSYNGFAGVSSPEKTLDLLNATQYATIMNEKSVAAGGPIRFADPAAFGEGTDWQKQIFNNSAVRYSHELSISGGNDVSSFYASFGVQDQEGIVLSDISNYNKKNFRLNSTHKISKIFTFGQTFGFSRQKSTGIGNTNNEYGGPLASAISLDPLTPVVETDPFVINSKYTNPTMVRDANGNPYAISEFVGGEMTNPLAYEKTRLGGYNWSDDLVGNAYFEAAISKSFKFRTTFGGKMSYWGNQGFTPEYYLSATSKVLENSYGKSENSSFAWNVENTATYTKSLGDHNFTVLLGQGAYVDNIGGGSSATMKDLPITSYQDASFNFDIPQAKRASSTYDQTQHKLTSLFARVNYDFNEKYLFTGIIRRDGSSRFGDNNKYGVFPSFNLGWVVTKEDFWKENNVLNTLKIRGGYGVVGNDAIPDFRYLSLVEGGYNYAFGTDGQISTGYANLTLDNPDLRWEETSQVNIGFESRLFHDLSLTVDVYNKTTNGILRPVNIPGYVGVAQNPTANIADMENRGIEVELGYRKHFGDVNFSVNGNFAYLENEVTYVASDSDYIVGDASFQSMGTVTRTKVGQSYNSFYGFKTAGIFQNEAEIAAYTNASGGLIQPKARPGDFRWVDTDGNGTINDDDKQFLGSNIPKYTFGLTLNLDYKNFDFMAFAQGAAGNKVFQGLHRLDIANVNYQSDAMGRWTGEGTSNDYPRLTDNDTNANFGKMSDFHLENGDYVRLKLIQLGYSLPTNVVSQIGASKIRFYLTGENLFTITKYTGFDPEIGGGVFGIDKGVYPQAKSFMFGASAQF